MKQRPHAGDLLAAIVNFGCEPGENEGVMRIGDEQRAVIAESLRHKEAAAVIDLLFPRLQHLAHGYGGNAVQPNAIQCVGKSHVSPGHSLPAIWNSDIGEAVG